HGLYHRAAGEPQSHHHRDECTAVGWSMAVRHLDGDRGGGLVCRLTADVALSAAGAENRAICDWLGEGPDGMGRSSRDLHRTGDRTFLLAQSKQPAGQPDLYGPA